jgi:hypothetical protein
MINILERTIKKRSFAAVALALIALFSIMRLAHINADAPQDLSISAAAYTDEGFKTYTSRNLKLFGSTRWTPEDEYESWEKQSPLSVKTYDMVFNIFGVSFKTTRIPSVIYSILTMGLLSVFMFRRFGAQTAAVGLVLFGLSFFNVMYNRLGFYESHLLFYIMLMIFGFSEAFSGNKNGGGSMIAKALFFAMGLSGLIGGYFIKRNMLIIIPAIVPVLPLIFCKKKCENLNTANKIFIAVLSSVLLFYVVFGHFDIVKIVSTLALLTTPVLGQSLSTFLPVFIFDRIHMVLSKGMYLEFVFLQPIISLAAMSYALYSFHRYIFTDKRDTIDLVLSSWLMFGFAFLNIIYYHPSRYYLVLSLPLAILAARALIAMKDAVLSRFITGKKPFPHNILFAGLIVFALAYTGVVISVIIVPFSFRQYLLTKLYPAFMGGQLAPVYGLVAAMLLVEAVIIIGVVLARKKITDFIVRTGAASVIFSAIVCLHVFQYARWFAFHGHTLYETSVELGKTMPGNAVIAGGWSADLVMENGLRPLILQSHIPYNQYLVKKIMLNQPLPTNSLAGGRFVAKNETDIPLYISLCRNVVFEETIVNTYKHHCTRQNLFKKIQLGYFTVEIFRTSKLEPLEKDVMSDIFKSFL